ncbi:MAG: sigma-70 family RNA polymerase sigma factor [Candidatus Latescibacterota bacterium]|nr:MAG: sigma-70 family RNA polymerase sigma factor [Candidatus Latescibacterota bacterium]
MERTAGGDEEAFRLLVERWERPIFRFLDRMLSSPEEAEDASQETFLRVFEQARRYRPEGQFRSWLFRIAGNLARSRLRRRKVLQWVRLEPVLHDRPDPGERADGAIEKRELRRAVREAVRALPERQKQAVLLRRYEEMSYAEIATAMGVTVPAVESLLQRATAALRSALAGTVV